MTALCYFVVFFIFLNFLNFYFFFKNVHMSTQQRVMCQWQRIMVVGGPWPLQKLWIFL